MAVLLLIAAGVSVFLYRDKLFDGSLKKAEEKIGSQEPYTYENGANQQFSLIGGKLAIASSTGIQLLDENGEALFRQVFTMKNPALCTCRSSGVFYDVGGTGMRLWSGGELTELDTDEAIISVSMNSGGYFAAATQSSGYKGSVTVYSPQGEGIFKWFSGTGYVLDAALSPDAAHLAVLCLESTGSTVHIFNLGDEAQAAEAYLPLELAFEIVFTDNGSFCLLSESSLSFFSADGGMLRKVDFAGSYLIEYSLSDELCVLALSRYISGSEVVLGSYSSDGEDLGSCELSFSPQSLSRQGKKLLVLGNGRIFTYSGDMTLLTEAEIPAGYSDALYLPGEAALLLSAYHGEKISVR